MTEQEEGLHTDGESLVGTVEMGGMQYLELIGRIQALLRDNSRQREQLTEIKDELLMMIEP